MKRTSRKRTRRKRSSLLPHCYKHRKPMRVGRVVGQRQYRYCPVPGCRITLRTLRPNPTREEDPIADPEAGAGPETTGAAATGAKTANPEAGAGRRLPALPRKNATAARLCLSACGRARSQISDRFRRLQKLSYTFQ